MSLERDTTLGNFLRHERELRGITIEQVASATKVGVRSLHALEADQYVELPAKPFIRGFVTSYCRFIGLEPKDVLARFDNYLTLKSAERPRRDAGHSGYAFEKRDGEQQSRTFLFFAIFGFLVVGGTTMLVLKPSLRHHRSRSQVEKLKEAHQGASALNLVNLDSGSLMMSENPLSRGRPRQTVASSGPTNNGRLSISLANTSTTFSTNNPANLAPANSSAGLVPTNATSGANLSTSPSSSSPAKDLGRPAPVLPETAEAKSKKGDEASALVAEKGGEEKIQPDKKEGVGQNPDDPLDSGLALKHSEIQQKAVFKALEDIWVRYRVDDRPIRKFIIRKGKVLVLRAQKLILFQVSNSKSVTFKYNGQNRGVLEDYHGLQSHNGNLTLVLPKKGLEIDQIPFPHAPLPKTSDPQREQPQEGPSDLPRSPS